MTRSVSQFLLYFLAVNCVPFNEINYCKHPCRSAPHLLCTLKGNCNPSKTCNKWDKDGLLTDHEKEFLLSKHNQLRNLVATGGETQGLNGEAQPSASNMMKLKWDPELEYMAQCHVNQCKFEHDKCRNKADGTYVGQNLGLSSSADIDSVFDLWKEEVVNFDPTLITKFGSSAYTTGHYTQLVWADTTEIGCARALYRENSMTLYLIACNYAPGGNVLNTPVYKIGKQCSYCPAGTACPNGRSNMLYGLCIRNETTVYADGIESTLHTGRGSSLSAGKELTRKAHSSAVAGAFNQVVLKILVMAQLGICLYWILLKLNI